MNVTSEDSYLNSPAICFKDASPKLHIIVNSLTRYDFPLRSAPPKDYFGHKCTGWISKSLHFEIYLKSGCLVLSTSLEWTTHSTKEAETWSYHFLKRMVEFTKLSEFERESNKEKSKEERIEDLCGDASFETF